jgi:NAD(P)-dependent dehydrogenase (short-subunit alcohol dehydrogenase family)
MMGKWDGKVALITGGYKGMDFTTAQRCIAEGAEHVFISLYRQAALANAVKLRKITFNV